MGNGNNFLHTCKFYYVVNNARMFFFTVEPQDYAAESIVRMFRNKPEDCFFGQFYQYESLEPMQTRDWY